MPPSAAALSGQGSTAASATPNAPGRARAAPDKSGPQRALEKLGLVRPIDHALHLPIRYDDETRLVPIADLRDGEPAQIEGVITACEVQQRSRPQLVVRVSDGHGEVLLRFLHFHSSQQKTWGRGRRVRVRGESRGGFFGREMVHPAVRIVDAGTPLPTTLTPVYPTSAQLPQAYLRKAVAANLARADLAELLPAALVPEGLPPLRDALALLHRPPADAPLAALDARRHPAWQRLKFEELLAQQLSQLQARRERDRQTRAPLRGTAARPAGKTARCVAVRAHRGAASRGVGDRGRSGRNDRRRVGYHRADAPPAAR